MHHAQSQTKRRTHAHVLGKVEACTPGCVLVQKEVDRGVAPHTSSQDAAVGHHLLIGPVLVLRKRVRGAGPRTWRSAQRGVLSPRGLGQGGHCQLSVTRVPGCQRAHRCRPAILQGCKVLSHALAPVTEGSSLVGCSTGRHPRPHIVHLVFAAGEVRIQLGPGLVPGDALTGSKHLPGDEPGKPSPPTYVADLPPGVGWVWVPPGGPKNTISRSAQIRRVFVWEVMMV